MDDDDELLWQKISEDIKPIKNDKPRLKKTPPEKKPIVNRGYERQPDSPNMKNLKYLEHSDTSAVDKNTASRLKSGELEIEAKLDLHGKTQEEASGLLKRFIHSAYEGGRRCVLVVTGKGHDKEGGVLKTQVPRWLNEPEIREFIVMFSYAKPMHGGEGAIYVLVRRKRS